MNNTYPKKYTDALRELVETNTTFTSLVKKYSLYDIKFKKLLNEITLMKYLYSNCNIYLERKYSLGKPFLWEIIVITIEELSWKPYYRYGNQNRRSTFKRVGQGQRIDFEPLK